MKREMLSCIGAVAMSLSPTYLANAHEEPDFNKLPDVRQISRTGILTTLHGAELYSADIATNSMFKVGEKFGKHYYATADHINKVPTPVPSVPLNTIREEYRYNNHKMDLEFRDTENDIMIVSTDRDFGDKTVKICDSKPKLGESSYVYGYHAGSLSLSEGRVASLESDITGDGSLYYMSSAASLPGASGSPSIVYRDGEFCAYGMMLSNVNRGVFSLARDIKHTVDSYKEASKD